MGNPAHNPDTNQPDSPVCPICNTPMTGKFWYRYNGQLKSIPKCLPCRYFDVNQMNIKSATGVFNLATLLWEITDA